MSLKSFLSSLLPHFERSRIIEDIDSQLTELEKHQIPNYKAASQTLKGHKFVSAPGRAMGALFQLRNPRIRNVPHLQYITGVLENTTKILRMVEGLVPELFARDVTKDALTYKKAAVLQLLSVIRFTTNYSGLYLDRVLAAETALIHGQADKADAQLTPVDKKFLDDNLETFLQAAKLLSDKSEDLADRLGKMEDIQIVADKINFVTSTMGVDTVDPLRLGFMGLTATSSPIYMVRSMLANYQDATYKRNVELSKSIQLRLYSIKDAKQGKNDPALQQKIDYLEGRLARLNQDVADYEARFGS